MKIAYLLNAYPMTSTTFIRREIEAVEERGIEIRRYAVRHWDQRLVEPLDVAEQQRTRYLLTGNIGALIASFFLELISNPFGFWPAIRVWLRLCANQRELSPRLVAYFLQACYLRREARAEGIGHVHAHFATNATAVAMLAQALGGPSYSFTSHGPDEFVEAKSISLTMKIERAAFVVAISEYCRAQLMQVSAMACWDKIVIARCGLNLDDFVAAKESGDVDQTFVCVGRLCPQKGQLLIPRAIAMLRDEFPQLRVEFVGDGESRAQLQQAIAECGVAQHVELHGWQGSLFVRQLVARSRALLLPSFAEGLPVVIMEAFALGRPVLSTFIAGIPELVDDRCGWIFPAGSIDHLAGAMRAALSASPAALSAMGREGRSRVEHFHDLRAIAATLAHQFAQLPSTGR